jgi:hypothetical protein
MEINDHIAEHDKGKILSLIFLDIISRHMVTETIFEESSSEKENINDNLSSEKDTLHNQIVDYFARFDDDEKKLEKLDQNKQSSVSLHPSMLPKAVKSHYSPAGSSVSGLKYTAGYLSQKRTNPLTKKSYPKNLFPMNLNSALSKCDDFTYKSPNDQDFSEFKSDDYKDIVHGTL